MRLPVPIDRKPALRRGGARLKADRQTIHLTERDCHKVITGAQAAWRHGLPFNRFITGAWQRGGQDRAASVRATGEFINLLRDWLRAQGYPLAWAWVQEWSAKTGAHCHILLHIPPELDPLFRGKPRHWARKILGGHYVTGVIQSKRLTFAPIAALSPEDETGIWFAAPLAAQKSGLTKPELFRRASAGELAYRDDLPGRHWWYREKQVNTLARRSGPKQHSQSASQPIRK